MYKVMMLSLMLSWNFLWHNVFYIVALVVTLTPFMIAAIIAAIIFYCFKTEGETLWLVLSCVCYWTIMCIIWDKILSI